MPSFWSLPWPLLANVTEIGDRMTVPNVCWYYCLLKEKKVISRQKCRKSIMLLYTEVCSVRIEQLCFIDKIQYFANFICMHGYCCQYGHWFSVLAYRLNHGLRFLYYCVVWFLRKGTFSNRNLSASVHSYQNGSRWRLHTISTRFGIQRCARAL